MTEIDLELAFLTDAGMNAASAVTVTFRTDDTDNTDASQVKWTPPISSKHSVMTPWFGYAVSIKL